MKKPSKTFKGYVPKKPKVGGYMAKSNNANLKRIRGPVLKGQVRNK